MFSFPSTTHQLFRPLTTLLLLALLSWGSLSPARAQFWKATPTSPNGPKQGLSKTDDNTLFTIVDAGILATRDQGLSWSLAFRTTRAHSLFTTRGGQVLAGGQGQVYLSKDNGLSWDSVALATPYPVVEFVETPAGGLLAATGTIDLAWGYVGGGVFFSADNGRSWTARNTGLGTGRFVNHLAADRHGRLYLSVADEEAWRLPGLFTSDDNGLSWRHVPFRIDGRNTITNDLVAYELTTLAVTPQDTLLCSFHGTASSVGVRLNLKKGLDAVSSSSFWKITQTYSTSMWWMDQLLSDVHFARNGDWYSSRAGSQLLGGTMVSRNQGRHWNLTQSGLGLNMYGTRSRQHFAETATGKIFMVQDFDQQVYTTSASVITATKPQLAAAVQLFPNPTAGTVQVLNQTGTAIKFITLTDLSGRLIRRTEPAPGAAGTALSLHAEPGGIYLVSLVLADGRQLSQRLVKE